MKALIITDNASETLQMTDVVVPTFTEDCVLLRMTAAALNHRDQWIREGKYPNIVQHSILGSDGCGIVEKVFNHEQEKAWLGKTVIVNPNINWGSNPDYPSPDYRILGMPDAGTFAEYLAVPVHRLHEKPNFLTDEQAAALPLGALTAYRALFTYGQVKAGQNVLISGVGGGVALFAFQFAVAAGANVWVTSGSEEKIQKAIAAGAKGGANYKHDDWNKTLLQVANGFDIVIDSAGGEGFSRFVRMMKRGGRIVFYGATQGLPPNLDLHRAFFYQLRLQGSTMGNDEEFEDMLTFVEKHQIVPFVDSTRPFSEILSALNEMKQSTQFGKLVVKF